MEAGKVVTQMGLHKHLRPFQVNEAYPLGFARVKHDSYLNEETSREKKKRQGDFWGKKKDLSLVLTTSINGSPRACRSQLTTTLTWWKGNRGGWRLDVAEPETTSSLTRCWSRTIIMGNEIAQLNVIIDVLSRWSKSLEEMTSIFGKAGKQVLERKNAESST